MTEITQEQIDTINLRAAGILEELLKRIAESEDQTSETLEIISETYGGMIVLTLLGFNVMEIASDADAGALRLVDLLAEEVGDDATTSD